jgi:AAA15 family ATPase/GTPase
MTLKLLDMPKGKERVLPFLREADSGIMDVEFIKEPLVPNTILLGQSNVPLIYQDSPTSAPTLAKVTFSHQSVDDEKPIGLDIGEESSGTQILFHTAGAWLNVFANGEILLVDEIETSLHSLLVMFLISRFHSDKTNPNKSQMIFTTHNTSLLNQDIFRRDQIWFVEKDVSNASRLYPLSDFSPRKDEVIEKWYMRGRYGALPIIDDGSH